MERKSVMQAKSKKTLKGKVVFVMKIIIRVSGNWWGQGNWVSSLVKDKREIPQWKKVESELKPDCWYTFLAQRARWWKVWVCRSLPRGDETGSIKYFLFVMHFILRLTCQTSLESLLTGKCWLLRGQELRLMNNSLPSILLFVFKFW